MQKRKISSLTIFLIIQIAILAILTVTITRKVSATTRANSLDHMKTITDERAQIIDSYVRSAERTLSAYSRAGQITALLKDPTNHELQKAAQSYTELFSHDIPELEGIYVSEWNTHVLAHTSIAAVGITTRENPDSLAQLQNAMLDAGNGVYNTGIIISPASYKQIVSMYKAVYDTETGEPMLLTYSSMQYRDEMETKSMDMTLFHFSGAEYPVPEKSSFENKAISFRTAFMDLAEAALFELFYKRTVCIKTPKDNVVIGVFSAYTKTESRFFVGYDFTIQQIHFSEVVDL